MSPAYRSAFFWNPWVHFPFGAPPPMQIRTNWARVHPGYSYYSMPGIHNSPYGVMAAPQFTYSLHGPGGYWNPNAFQYASSVNPYAPSTNVLMTDAGRFSAGVV
eukprot:TRINITY_DN58332_c0_g1_i2.p2 TRINITY_DN58332_c0_g1~~TRINITY_DN58332_c0_g1_i2.p2  ORF type:complete len:104 (+),score=48.28 TRINITY_DN58332_c0_g1_i2:147-458(+)